MIRRILASLLAMLLLVLTVQAPLVALAGVATTASLTISDQTISTAANHTFTFVTPTGVESSTDTIVLDYASGFSLAAIALADIDLAYDDDSACDGAYTDLTLGASAGVGTWGVAIIGQTITFTAPTDAGAGEIPAGRCVQVQIGDNASGGSDQIVNPGSSGSYEIDIYGEFGDRTLFSVGITGASGVTVSTTVSSGGGSTPGGGGSPPTGDTTAPVISNIVVQDITTTTARITWNTDEPSATTFVYGEDTSYTLGSVPDPAFRTSHERIIGGLQEGTEYHFLIGATDSSSNSSSSGDQTFSTLDLTAPVISNVVVSGITESSAIITWDTDEPATSSVTGDFGTQSDATLTVSHEIVLTGLSDNTVYSIVIASSDASGNTSDVTESFQTLEDVPPTAPSNFVATPGDTVVYLSWNNPEEDDFSQVEIYALQAGEVAPDVTYPTSPGMGVLVYSGEAESAVHSGLVNGQRYYYTIYATDLGGNVSAGANATAVPTASSDDADDTDPDADDSDDSDGEDDSDDAGSDTGEDGTDSDEGGSASGTGGLALTRLLVTNIDEDSATVSWETNVPTDARVTIEGIPSIYDPALNEVHTLAVGSLSPATTYTVTVVSVDAEGNRVTATTSFTTPSEEVLTLTDLRVLTDSPTTATVLFETAIPSRGSVVITEVGTFSGPGLVMGHEIGLTDLEPDTLYVARVTARASDGSEVTQLISFTTPKEVQVGAVELSTVFRVARGTITLSTTGNRVRVLPGRDLSIVLTVEGTEAPQTVRLTVGDAVYTMTRDASTEVDASGQTGVVRDYVYTARIMTPAQSAALTIEALGTDGQINRSVYDLRVMPVGVVRAEAGAVSSALVTATTGGATWPATNYAQTNPLQTGDSGAYAWYVPNGTYRVQVAADGYVAYTSASTAVTDNILALPVTLIESLPSLNEVDGPIVAAIAERVVQQVNVIRQNPTVQTAADVTAPVIAVTAVSTAGVLATGFNAIGLLQYVFSAPFLFFYRRKRKRWGVVYDSLKKTPVDLAIVRLKEATTGRVVKSVVTDREGRYLFIASPGRYIIDVRKEGYVFPTSVLKDQKRDGDYLDLYHGEPIDVTQEGAALTANIPLDAGEQEKSVRQITWDTWKRRIMYGVSVLGLVLAIGVAVIDPSAWTISVAVFQILVLLLFLRLAKPKTPKNWGIVYDKTTRKPLAKTVVRIFDPKYNKLLETRITDSRGRYAFLVGPSAFYATYDKSGYETVRVDPIDRTDAHKSSYVSIDVGLDQHKN